MEKASARSDGKRAGPGAGAAPVRDAQTGGTMAGQPRHQWYIWLNGTEHGPLSARFLFSLARAGKIRPDTPVRRDDMTQAVPAGRVRGLLDGTAPPKTAPPRPGTASVKPAVTATSSSSAAAAATSATTATSSSSSSATAAGKLRPEGAGTKRSPTPARTAPAGVAPSRSRVDEPARERSGHGADSGKKASRLPEIALKPIAAPAAARSGKFRDPSLLVNWVEICLWACLCLAVVGIATRIVSHGILTDLRDGTYASAALSATASEAFDRRERFLSVMELFLFAVTSVLALKWIHRANFNARQLGAEGMRFTPGWAVGSYFIPIVNLWKPYQAMKEIWKASSSPANWQGAPSGALLGIWWFLWLLSTFANYAVFRFFWAIGERIQDFIAANALAAVMDVLEIPLTVSFLILVKKITKMQMAHAHSRS